MCIRMEGRNDWNTATAIWTNPPKQVGKAQTAHRKGKTLNYTSSSFEQGTDATLCVRFKGINRVACDKIKHIGDRTSF
ncbi:hypothetical protein ACPB9J_05980 [Streptomyces lavendulocolor]|uniref:hypothetical protein n=1 Tax=Streptomyces lavendulocolor TaxID=67316 RepID=UPI003C2F6BD2